MAVGMCALARQPPKPTPPASRPSRQFHPVTAGVPMVPARSTVSTSTITFHVRVKGMQSNERLFLVGGGEDLGEWMVCWELQSSDRRKWSVRVPLKPEQTVEYKYIRISQENGQSFVQWEEGPNSKNRQFYFSGGSTVKDDADLSHFRPKEALELPLAKQTFYEEPQETAADRSSGLNGNSVTVTVSQGSWWAGKPEEKAQVATSEWASEMFEKVNSVIQSLCDKVDNKLEQQLSDLKHRQDQADEQANFSKRWLVKLESMIENLAEKMEYAKGTPKTGQEEIAKDSDNSVNMRQLLAEHLRDSTLAQKQRALEHDMASLQEKVERNAALLSGSDNKFLKLESAIASSKNDIAGMQREISKLDLKIPELDDRLPGCDTIAQKDFQQAQGQLKELESQVASLTKELQKVSQKMSEPPGAPAAPAKMTDLPSPVDPAHADRGNSPSLPTQGPFPPSEMFDEWNEVGWKQADSMGGSDVAPRRRSASMPKYTVPKGRAAFTGLTHPKKPDNEEMKKLCLQVEQDLVAARKRNDPVDLRKRLLKEVLLRLHPDKTGQSSEAMNWFESWKNTHVKWYYEPHDVPEADRKYFSKPSSGKDL